MRVPITICYKIKRLGQQWFGRLDCLAARECRHFGAFIYTVGVLEFVWHEDPSP